MLTVVWLVLGMLAGAAILTGLLWVIYIGTCIFERVASSGWGWLFIPNLCVGPFIGAGLGFVGAIHYCGYTHLAKTAAIFVGLAALTFLAYFTVSNDREELPAIYTWRQGVPVVLRCAAEIIAMSFFCVPIPFLVAVGLVFWGLTCR